MLSNNTTLNLATQTFAQYQAGQLELFLGSKIGGNNIYNNLLIHLNYTNYLIYICAK